MLLGVGIYFMQSLPYFLLSSDDLIYIRVVPWTNSNKKGVCDLERCFLWGGLIFGGGGRGLGLIHEKALRSLCTLLL